MTQDQKDKLEELRTWLTVNASYLAWIEVEAVLEVFLGGEREKIKDDLLKIADQGEIEDLRREVLIYFSK